MAIKPLTLANGAVIYVDVEDTDVDITLPPSPTPADTPMPDLPGAEPTGIPSMDDVVIGGKLLQETISGAAQSVYDSLSGLKPDEWTVELQVGFESSDKGIIAYLGKGNGSLKVTATWKKGDPPPTDE